MLSIYVISLKTDIKRREVIKSKLNCLQVAFEFVDAIYGEDLPGNVISHLGLVGDILDRRFLPTKFEIGCALSHLKVYQLMLQRGQTWSCILEDDVILDDRFKDFINNFDASQLMFNELDMYLLGRQSGRLTNLFIAESYRNFFYVGSQKFVKAIKSEKYIFGAYSYLINACLAKKIILLSQSSFMLADDWEYMVNKKIVSNIYLSDFVNHPEDMSSSNLEIGRKDGDKEVKNKLDQRNFFKKIFFNLIYKIKFCLRLMITQLYRFKK